VGERAMKMDIRDIAGLLDSGLYVKAANPWLNPSGELYKYAIQNNFNLRPGLCPKEVPPHSG